eukprot:gb/GECG01004509.1/.p1 GENE.gb/GECG01004509.1/~~gb/GECG01004509.1/.p1  ORF type:complete len:380 (+),score=47.23 gb/GECG01004509.1/:1-1140(+)
MSSNKSAEDDDLPQGREVRRCVGHRGAVFRAKFTSDGNYCMTAGHDKTVRLWNPHKNSRGEGEEQTSPEEPPRRKKSRKQETETAMLVKTWDKVHSSAVYDVAVAHDNDMFASCGRDKPVYVWSVSKDTVTRRCFGHQGHINCVRFSSPDSNVLLSGSEDKTVQMWDLRARPGKPIQTLSDATDSITSIDVHSDGFAVVTGSVDGKVRTYDLRKGELFEDDLGSPVTNVSISHNNDCLLASCMRQAKSRRHLTLELSDVGSENSSKTSARHTAATHGGAVRLLDWNMGEQLATYSGHIHSEYPLQSAFMSTDRYVVGADETGCARLWELVSGKEMVRFQHKAHEQNKNNTVVCGIDTNPKLFGKQILTACFDGTVRIWN